MGKIELFAVPAVQHKVRRDGDVMFIFGGGGWGGTRSFQKCGQNKPPVSQSAVFITQ